MVLISVGEGNDSRIPSHSVSHVPASFTSPRIFPLSIPRDESEDRVIIGCLIKDFFPMGPVNVNWSKDGKITNFPPALASGGSLYTMSSQLNLTATDCPEGARAICSVEHATSAPQTKDVFCPGQRASWGGPSLLYLSPQ